MTEHERQVIARLDEIKRMVARLRKEHLDALAGIFANHAALVQQRADAWVAEWTEKLGESLIVLIDRRLAKLVDGVMRDTDDQWWRDGEPPPWDQT